jgi:hypothetical protein
VAGTGTAKKRASNLVPKLFMSAVMGYAVGCLPVQSVAALLRVEPPASTVMGGVGGLVVGGSMYLWLRKKG